MKPTINEATVLTALSEAFKYNIADWRVIVQVHYLNAAEPNIFFVPEAPIESGRSDSDWRIEVTFPEGSRGKPKITTSGLLEVLDPGSTRLMLRDAVLAASQRFNRLLHPPFIVSVKATGGMKRAYLVGCSALPVIRGAHWLVQFSEDLKEYSVIPGR